MGPTAKEVLGRERPRSHHKGRKRSGGNAGTGRLRFKAPRECHSTPPGVSVRPFRLYSQGSPGFYWWPWGNNRSPLGRGWCPFGRQFWWLRAGGGSASWESACPPGPLAQRCLASPRLCPGFLRLRGIGMRGEGGLALADMGWVEQSWGRLLVTGLPGAAALEWHLPPGWHHPARWRLPPG